MEKPPRASSVILPGVCACAVLCCASSSSSSSSTLVSSLFLEAVMLCWSPETVPPPTPTPTPSTNRGGQAAGGGGCVDRQMVSGSEGREESAEIWMDDDRRDAETDERERGGRR